MVNIRPVILCGGSGTRLWPLSRSGFPKQFLCLTGADSLFQQAVKRVAALYDGEAAGTPPFVVCNEEHRFLALEQLREIKIEPGAVLLERAGHNTAPALTLAALAALENGDDPVLVVTPADQTIINSVTFTRAIHVAISQAVSGAIVIFGIKPDRPETGYGYIKMRADNTENSPVVESFVEKPDTVSAQCFLDEGGYFWNAGIFVLKASVWLQAVEYFRPDISEPICLAWEKRTCDSIFSRPGQVEFTAVPNESIDNAVIARCPGSRFPIAMVPLDAGWSDLGAWDAVWSILPKDAEGNACIGDVLTYDSRNNLVNATSRLVSLVGVENIIVVETPDAVLVIEKSHSQNVKKIVRKLEKLAREEHITHRKVHRPWGWYDNIDEGPRFKVKRIQVKPKASLSLQKHYRRAEHWVVVKGTAEITCGDKIITLNENQSTYIPLGEIHRLANPENIPLEIIEIQSGDYLGEDDIVRLEDSYGRHDTLY